MATLQEIHAAYCLCDDAAWDRYCDSMIPTYSSEDVDHITAQDARLISDLTTENYALSTALDWYVRELQRMRDKYEPNTIYIGADDCEHGLSAALCHGPNHYGDDDYSF